MYIAILFFVKGNFRDNILTHKGLAASVHFEVRDNSIPFSIRMESLGSYYCTPNTLSMPYQHDAVCFSFHRNEVVLPLCALIMFF